MIYLPLLTTGHSSIIALFLLLCTGSYYVYNYYASIRNDSKGSREGDPMGDIDCLSCDRPCDDCILYQHEND